MSLVFDALQQHREPATASVTSRGSVLPDSARSVQPNKLKVRNIVLVLMVLLILLVAGGFMYQLGSNNFTGAGDNASSEPQAVANHSQLPVSPAAEPWVDVAPVTEDIVATDAAPVHVQNRVVSKPEAPAVTVSSAKTEPVILASTVVGMVAKPAQTPVVKPSLPVVVQASEKVAGEIASLAGSSAAIVTSSPNAKSMSPQSAVRQVVTEPVRQEVAADRATIGTMKVASVVEVTRNLDPDILTESVITNESVSSGNSMAPKEIALTMARFNDAVRADDFESARALQGKVSTALGADSLVTLRMGGFLALKMGDLQKARESYQQVVASLPNDHEANRNLAVIDVRQGNSELSKKRSLDMLKIYPEDAVFKVLAN